MAPDLDHIKIGVDNLFKLKIKTTKKYYEQLNRFLWKFFNKCKVQLTLSLSHWPEASVFRSPLVICMLVEVKTITSNSRPRNCICMKEI